MIKIAGDLGNLNPESNPGRGINDRIILYFLHKKETSRELLFLF